MITRVSLAFSLALSLGIPAPAAAQARDWSHVGTTGDTSYFIDSASVVTTRNGMVDAWIKASFARTIPERNGYQHDTRLSRYRIDCAKSIWMGRETAYYRGSTLVRRTSSAARAIPYKPLWEHERELLQLACRIAGLPAAQPLP